MKIIYAYLIAAALAVVSILIGLNYPITLSPSVWMLILAAYTFVACEAPVWVILQPRDFVNVQILYAGIAAMIVGVVIGGLEGLSVSAPLASCGVGAAKMGPVWPFLFITIACGAISGFHALVCGGTTSKQLARESQARLVSYGAMLLEGVLALLVLLAIGACLSYDEYLNIVWPDAGGGNPILAFALALGHLLNSTVGLALPLGAVFGILLVEGFLVTTLDTAVRLNRYLFEELWRACFARVPRIIRIRGFNAGLSVALMLLFALTNGYKLIWPLFGATNQLLAALTLVTITVWLRRASRKSWFVLGPAVVMIVTTIAALAYSLIDQYLPQGAYLLAATDLLLLALAVGVAVLAARKIFPHQVVIAGQVSP